MRDEVSFGANYNYDSETQSFIRNATGLIEMLLKQSKKNEITFPSKIGQCPIKIRKTQEAKGVCYQIEESIPKNRQGVIKLEQKLVSLFAGDDIGRSNFHYKTISNKYGQKPRITECEVPVNEEIIALTNRYIAECSGNGQKI